MSEAASNAGTHRSRLLVIGIILLGVVVSIIARIYVASGDDYDSLVNVDCSRMQPTIGELQGVRLELDRQRVCAALRAIASAPPITDNSETTVDDPWHYIGRVRVQPDSATWFLVFMARRSTGFRPELSVRNRRGAGWAVVGHFDGTNVLERLGLLDDIDRTKLLAPASLQPRDQRQRL